MAKVVVWGCLPDIALQLLRCRFKEFGGWASEGPVVLGGTSGSWTLAVIQWLGA
ncbi:hypothetical protein ACVINW_003642 [Bradyrhizobium sp. USDA 4461]